MTSSPIVLTTLNSTYQHTAFGLRYLKANLHELKEQCSILEFTIDRDLRDVALAILKLNPRIIGVGVYIWNTEFSLKLIQLLKKLEPQVTIILGGPEISYETESQLLLQFCDYVIKGEGEVSFYKLCRKILIGETESRKIIPGEEPNLKDLNLPYSLYNDEDLKNRFVYVEASRGCPYKCEYCLSSLDLKVRSFQLDSFLSSMEELINRGARDFKFVDRTFNLSPLVSTEILRFFLRHVDKNLFLHFEMVPDRLPDELKELVIQFPPGSLQFEIGIQTWSSEVATLVSRKNNYEKVKENLRFLKTQTTVHTHTDLIFGLPGETLDSFANGFDQLIELEPSEIQVGILKRLKGTPIVRHDEKWSMVYQDHPPFQIVKTKLIPFEVMQQMQHFSRFWDWFGNSGHFTHCLALLKIHCRNHSLSVFWALWSMSLFVKKEYPTSHSMSLANQTRLIWKYFTEDLGFTPVELQEALTLDYQANGKRATFDFLNVKETPSIVKVSAKRKRQSRHLLEDVQKERH